MNPQIQKAQQIPIRINNQESHVGSIMVYLLESQKKRKTISVNRYYAQKIKMGMT